MKTETGDGGGGDQARTVEYSTEMEGSDEYEGKDGEVKVWNGKFA